MRNSDSVVNLILASSLGYFTLYDEFKNNTFGSFPNTMDEDSGAASKKASPQDLAIQLKYMLENLGAGKYKIELKANSKDNIKNVVSYTFQHGNIDLNKPNSSVSGGIGFTELNNQVETQVTKALERERELFEREKKLWELEKRLEILELKNSHTNEIGSIRAKSKESKEIGIEKYLPALVPLFIAGAVKLVPESKELIGKALDSLESTEDEPENKPVVKQVVRED